MHGLERSIENAVGLRQSINSCRPVPTFVKHPLSKAHFSRHPLLIESHTAFEYLLALGAGGQGSENLYQNRRGA